MLWSLSLSWTTPDPPPFPGQVNLLLLISTNTITNQPITHTKRLPEVNKLLSLPKLCSLKHRKAALFDCWPNVGAAWMLITALLCPQRAECNKPPRCFFAKVVPLSSRCLVLTALGFEMSQFESPGDSCSQLSRPSCLSK